MNADAPFPARPFHAKIVGPPIQDGCLPVSEFRVFLSTVSSEFAAARDALAKDLLARRLKVTWQEIFRQEVTSDTLLRLIHDYVRDCQAVVCAVGRRSGACPRHRSRRAMTGSHAKSKARPAEAVDGLGLTRITS